MLDDTPPIGCIVISGDSTTFYKISGTTITKCDGFDVNLPKKHGRGGQSQLRFMRLADEARHNYITKVTELSLKVYGNIPVIIGGNANMKNKLSERLSSISTAPKILRVVDIQYDKKQGLNEILAQCADIFSSMGIGKELEYMTKFMNSLALDDELCVYGKNNITYALTNNAVETILMHEDCINDKIVQICELHNTEVIKIRNLLPQSQQIKEGFGGIVGLLRYPLYIPYEIDDDNLEE